MYAWIFRHLPGPIWSRVLLSVLLVAGTLWLLVFVAFPWFSGLSHLTDATIGSGTTP